MIVTYDSVARLVHPSVVKATATASATLLFSSVFFFSYSSGNALSEKCCLEGIVYLGSRTWSRFWNPEFWTTLNGRRSLTINCRMAPEIAFALLELCGSLAENNVQRTCLLEWVVCLTVAASTSEDVDSDCSFKNLLCFLRKWSVRFVVLPLYFRIVLTGHNLHATLVLSTGPSFSFKKPKWFHTLDFAFLFGTISKDSSQAMFSFWEKAIEQLNRMSQCFLEGGQ